MKKIIIHFCNFFISFVKKSATYSANSLSMIGMYEPECPEELLSW